MNVNIVILAKITGQREESLEKEWRKAKRYTTNDGQKGNYLLAWEWMLTALQDKRACLIPAKIQMNGVVNYGSLTGIVVGYNEEFCYICTSTTTTHSPTVAIPIVLLMCC